MEAHKVLRDTVIRLEVGERPFCPSSRSPSPSPALTHHSLSPSPSSTPTATLQRPPERACVRRGWDPGGGRGGLHEGEGLQAMVHIYMCVCVYIACIYRLVHMYILYIHTCWYIYTYIYMAYRYTWPALQYRKQFRPELNRRPTTWRTQRCSYFRTRLSLVPNLRASSKDSWFERERGGGMKGMEEKGENFFITFAQFSCVYWKWGIERIALKKSKVVECVLRA